MTDKCIVDIAFYGKDRHEAMKKAFIHANNIYNGN